MKILLAIDESDESQLMLREVMRRPWPAGSTFRVLNVMAADPAAAPPGVPVPSAPLSEVPAWPVGTLRTREMLDASALRIAEAGAAQLAGAGITAVPTMREGAVGPEIIEEARACRVDLIVMGMRRHSLVRRVLIGTTASYVLHHAPCSVEFVREPDYA